MEPDNWIVFLLASLFLSIPLAAKLHQLRRNRTAKGEEDGKHRNRRKRC